LTYSTVTGGTTIHFTTIDTAVFKSHSTTIGSNMIVTDKRDVSVKVSNEHYDDMISSLAESRHQITVVKST